MLWVDLYPHPQGATHRWRLCSRRPISPDFDHNDVGTANRGSPGTPLTPVRVGVQKTSSLPQVVNKIFGRFA
jgi:hypothetical protein